MRSSSWAATTVFITGWPQKVLELPRAHKPPIVLRLASVIASRSAAAGRNIAITATVRLRKAINTQTQATLPRNHSGQYVRFGSEAAETECGARRLLAGPKRTLVVHLDAAGGPVIQPKVSAVKLVCGYAARRLTVAIMPPGALHS